MKNFEDGNVNHELWDEDDGNESTEDEVGSKEQVLVPGIVQKDYGIEVYKRIVEVELVKR